MFADLKLDSLDVEFLMGVGGKTRNSLNCKENINIYGINFETTKVKFTHLNGTT